MSLPPILTEPRQLLELARDLEGSRSIAVDLEADSLHVYREKVCLIQLSTETDTVLIDTLACPDLDALKPILADPSVRKIFHAADYDIRSLCRDFGIEIRGLFDTMISSQLLGEEKIGLADMLQKYFGLELDKQFQKADWSMRPLSEGMIRYAAEDTRHLHRLCEILEGQLERKNRLFWAKEEFEILERVRHTESEGPFFLRFKGAGTLSRRELAILEELLIFRDSEARRRDCPMFKVMGNKPLLEMAKSAPLTPQGMVAIEGISARQADRYGRALRAAVEAGQALPEKELPLFPRSPRVVKDPAVEERFELLRNWRKEKAALLELEPGVLINNATLQELARRHPKKEDALVEIPGMRRWQRGVLGEEIIGVLKG